MLSSFGEVKFPILVFFSCHINTCHFSSYLFLNAYYINPEAGEKTNAFILLQMLSSIVFPNR